MKTSDQKLEFAASNPTHKKHPNDSFTATLTPPRRYTGEHFEADWIQCIPSTQDGTFLITGRYDEGGGDAYVGIQIIFQKDLPDGEHEVGPKGSAVSGNLAFLSSWSINTEILRAKKENFIYRESPITLLTQPSIWSSSTTTKPLKFQMGRYSLQSTLQFNFS